MGGTGSGTGACVQNGPFKNMTVNIGPGFKTQPRCVNRQITNALSSLANKAAVDKALAPTTYEEAWITIYNGPHLGGHMALSMMVGTPKVSQLLVFLTISYRMVTPSHRLVIHYSCFTMDLLIRCGGTGK